MIKNMLYEIIQYKLSWIKNHKLFKPLKGLQNNIKCSNRNFYDSLKSKNKVFILECKKASPSTGLIRKNFNPVIIAKLYNKYASVISVVTDEKYFQGNFRFLSIVSNAIKKPILCKDFILDTYQIWLSRYYEADAVLLMLSLLNDNQYLQLSNLAHYLKMGVLTEIHNKKELKRAINLNAKVIGINNRNLKNFSINLNTTRKLAPYIKNKAIVISESGINKYSDIYSLKNFADGFLIGTSLLNSENINISLKRIIFGDNKVCGLNRPEDSYFSYKAGSVYGGLIFAKNSIRYIKVNYAKNIISNAPLIYVGIFYDNELNDILKIVDILQLQIIQLHGNENQDYIIKLRKSLPINTKIWKAINIIKKIPPLDYSNIHRYVFDSYKGGSGKCFNWSLLKGHNLSNIMIAGGLNEFNCINAIKLKCAGLDFCSGTENLPGIKDYKKIFNIFNKLKF